MRLTSESIDSEEQRALPNVGGPLPICWRPEHSKKVESGRKHSLCLTPLGLGQRSSAFRLDSEGPPHRLSWASSLLRADLGVCQPLKFYQPISWCTWFYIYLIDSIFLENSEYREKEETERERLPTSILSECRSNGERGWRVIISVCSLGSELWVLLGCKPSLCCESLQAHVFHTHIGTRISVTP